MTSNAARSSAIQARNAQPVRVSSRPGPLARLKLSEPVRLYAYTVLAAILTALVLTGTITGAWQEALTGIAAAVLAVVPAAEAGRASVYSPRTHVRQIIDAQRAIADRAARARLGSSRRAVDPTDVARQIQAAGL